MVTIRRDFDGYKLWYFSNDELFALIHCYKGTEFMGRISFFKEGDIIPPNANLPNGPSIHFAASRFNDIMTILKQERPLYLFLNPDTLTGMVANTHFEWTGEEEVPAEETTPNP
jgi:hypothetical protein